MVNGTPIPLAEPPREDDDAEHAEHEPQLTDHGDSFPTVRGMSVADRGSPIRRADPRRRSDLARFG
jgi:hypothetical protein